jgi:hypothetical protein
MGTWFQITTALRGGGVELSPAQRAAIAGALGFVPGVRTLGRGKDPNGNPTIGFERKFGNLRMRTFFSASTALTTYMDETLIRRTSRKDTGSFFAGPPGLPAETVLQRYELLDYSHLDATPKLKPTSSYGFAKEVCPEVKRKIRRERG